MGAFDKTLVTLSRHVGLLSSVMVDKHQALAKTTELTDMVLLYWDLNPQPMDHITKQQHCILLIAYQVLGWGGSKV